jgi:TolB protein
VSTRDGAYELYAMKADGSHQHRLTPDRGSSSKASTLYYQTDPAWSPDGKLIAFARYAPDPSGAYTCADPSGAYTCSGHVSTIAATGGTVRVFAKASGTNPSWSPDGRYIAFDNGRRIGIIDRSGGAIRFIATGTQPAWSPDGDTIAYVDGGNVWLIDARGRHRRLAIRNATDPAWRPAP